MSLRVVLLTRSGRPSGAQMAWRLLQSGFSDLIVLVEKRDKMVRQKKDSIFSLISKFGFAFLWERLWESVEIHKHFYLRKWLRDRFKNPVYLSIEELALDHPIRLIEVDDHNGKETADLLWRIQPDLGILTNTRRIKKEILEMPKQGFFNLHLSELPKYAGLDSIFWALYHGEKAIGVTVHAVADKIDRGEIILQKKIRVGALDNEKTLYEKALWLGTSLMVQAVKQLEEGTLERIPQDPAKASYFSWPTAKERAELKKRMLSSSRKRGSDSRLRGNDMRSGEDDKKDVLGDKRPRVLHMITRMSRGGAQENTLSTVRGLEKKGYAVTLLTGRSWDKEGEILSEALAEGLDVVVVPEMVREICLANDLKCLFRLMGFLKNGQFMIVHTHMSKGGLLGRLAIFLVNTLGANFISHPLEGGDQIPAFAGMTKRSGNDIEIRRRSIVVHTPHGHVFHSYFSPLKEKLFLFLERVAAKNCDQLVALTERCKAEHLELKVGSPDQWTVIPSGVNEKKFKNLQLDKKQRVRERFQVLPQNKIVGFIGRISLIKGPRYFVESFERISRTVPDTFFLIAGDGEERSELEKKVQQMDSNIQSRVRFVGDQKNVSEFLSLLDVLVVPSLNEGMGRVIVEGGLLGKPVVASRVGGIPDLIEDNETGLLVEARNSEKIADAVIQLLQDPTLSKRLGASLKERVLKGFTEDQMVDKIDQLYQRLIKNR